MMHCSTMKIDGRSYPWSDHTPGGLDALAVFDLPASRRVRDGCTSAR